MSHPSLAALVSSYETNNDPISEDHQQDIQRYTAALEHELTIRTAAVADLETTLAQRERCWNELRRHLLAAKVPLSAVRRFSNEIIKKIFLCSVEGDDGTGARPAEFDATWDEDAWRSGHAIIQHVLTMTHICRSWRHVGLSIPSLWKTISFPRPSTRACRYLVPKLMTLSDPLTLELKVDMTWIRPQYTNAIFAKLARCAFRVGTLALGIYTPEQLTQLAAKCDNAEWTQLKSLYLVSSPHASDHTFDASLLSLWRNAPRLTSVTLSILTSKIATPVANAASLLPWRQLSSLALTSSLPSETLLDIICCCHSLETLDIRSLSGEFPYPPLPGPNDYSTPSSFRIFVLPFIRDLRIKGWHGAANVLRRLYLPNLTSLESGGIAPALQPAKFGPFASPRPTSFHLRDLVYFLRTRTKEDNAKLTRLILAEQHGNLDQLLACLSLTPELSALELHCQTDAAARLVNTELLEALTVDPDSDASKPLIVPKLKKLWITVPWDAWYFGVVEVAEFGWSRGVTVGGMGLRIPDGEERGWEASVPELADGVEKMDQIVVKSGPSASGGPRKEIRAMQRLEDAGVLECDDRLT